MTSLLIEAVLCREIRPRPLLFNVFSQFKSLNKFWGEISSVAVSLYTEPIMQTHSVEVLKCD